MNARAHESLFYFVLSAKKIYTISRARGAIEAKFEISRNFNNSYAEKISSKLHPFGNKLPANNSSLDKHFSPEWTLDCGAPQPPHKKSVKMAAPKYKSDPTL